MKLIIMITLINLIFSWFLDFTANEDQKLNRPRPTKKPGTYIQSIWDIYGQRD